MEEVTKCSYINCTDTQEKERIFHELPICDTGLCVKWLINSGHEDLVGKDFSILRSLKFFVCSNHFSSDCYLAKGTLKENAVPKPHWSATSRKRDAPHIFIRTSNTGVRRANLLRTCTRLGYKVNEFEKQNKNAVKTISGQVCVDEWCRTCATKKPNLVSMTTKNQKTDMSLLSKLKLLIEIEDEDILPLSMCQECVAKLEQSFQFFQQIYIADNTLRHVFAKPQLNDRHVECNGVVKSNDSDQPVIKNHADNIQSHCLIKDQSMEPLSLDEPVIEAKTTEINTVKQHSPISVSVDDKRCTVFSLLADTCHSDEELQWVDVLKAMKRHNRLSCYSKSSAYETQVPCEFCSATFKRKRQLKSHLIVHHSKHTEYMCTDCVCCYENETTFLKHRVLYHKDKCYTCNYCSQNFTEKSKLSHHIHDLHFQMEFYSCDMCEKRFLSKDMLSNHIKDSHWSSQCTASEETVNNAHETEMVQKISSPENKELLDNTENSSCLNKPVSSMEVSLRRNDSIPTETTKESSCAECNIRLHNVEEVQVHRMDCHLKKRKDFTCLICENSCFCSLEEYEKHVDYHSKRLKTCM